ncbi:MAG: polyhydroxyalkanoic acid system family protein [Planctomycetes bacterium]|nr:polyhydroxyalkanoic acid system family protein [Planctomycetota bacterium]
MAEVTIRVSHTLGRAEALARLRRATEGLAQSGRIVRTLEWSVESARVAGDGFEGQLVVGETEVTGRVELGWKLAFFPLRVQREAEAWLREALA